MLARARAGDRDAFDALVSPQRLRLRAVIRRLVAHPEDTDDVVQDSLLQAFEKLDTFRGDARFGTWLCAIGARKALDYLRTRKRWRLRAQAIAEHECRADLAAFGDELATASGPDAALDVREHIAFCFTCVARTLDPSEAAALMLRDVEGQSTREAAQVLGVSTSVLRHTLSAARGQMREGFEGLCALVNKQGACWQCKSLRQLYPPAKRGPDLPALSDAQADAEAQYRWRLKIVCEADVDRGRTQALHDLAWRRVAHNEQARPSEAAAVRHRACSRYPAPVSQDDDASDRPRSPRHTAASSNIRPLITYAVARGLARDDVLRRFDIDPAALADVDGRLPLTTLSRLWNELPGLTGDPDMPLHVLEHAEMADPPLAMLIFLSAPTLGDALQRLVRYERLNFDLADKSLSEVVLDGEQAHIIVDHRRSAIDPPTGAIIDSFLGIVTLAGITTHRPLVPVAASVRHPEPRQTAPYRKALGCPVHFNAATDRLTLRASDLARPHPDASRTLAAIIETHAADKLTQLPQDEDLIASVRRCVRACLPEAKVALADIAAAMDLGPRTLQRKLEGHGTSLRQLLDEERRALALHYIGDRRTGLIEIAFLLGFSDQSALSRAFVRWTDCSPREYRRRLA